MGNKFKEFVTAAGLSVMLSASALGQDKKDIDLKAIEADSISITTTDGAVLFNKASSPDGMVITDQTQIRMAGRRESIQGQQQPAAGGRMGDSGGRTGGRTGDAGGRVGRTGTPTTGAPIEQPQTTQSEPFENRPMRIINMEDCLNISNAFITSSGGDGIRQQQRGSERTARASQTFVATCFDEGKKVATITFKAGQTQPVIELTEPEPGQ